MARPVPQTPPNGNDHDARNRPPPGVAGNGARQPAPPTARQAQGPMQSQAARRGNLEVHGARIEPSWDNTDARPANNDAADPVAEEQRDLAAEAQSREITARGAPVSSPEPSLTPDIAQDDWQSTPPGDSAESLGNVKPSRAAKRLNPRGAGTLYLILLAIVAASLSAAAVLFIF